jgi:hypothetical protein
MPETKIIELTPFRADLTRALARRSERLLNAADLAAEVAALEPLEAYYIVREIGLDQALPILVQLSPEQLETCIDLDCWQRYDFAVDSLDEWLSAYAQAGPETLARTFFDLDYVVQLIYLAQTMTVYDPDTDQVPAVDEEAEPRRAMTPDGFFMVETRDEIPLRTHPFAVLDALYQYDSIAAHQLLRQTRVDLPTQIEEEALRFRTGRLQDLGFIAPEEASVLFSRPTSQNPPPRASTALEDNPLRLPSLYAGPLSAATLLEQALSRITDQNELSRLEQEIVRTINSAIIAYGEKTREIKQIVDLAERVRDTISLGLEVLLARQDPDLGPDDPAAAERAAGLLGVWCCTDLFRHGFAATLGLQQQLQKALADPGFRAWLALTDAERSDEPGDRQERAFAAALQNRHPLRGGFDLAHPERLKAFASLAEIDVARVRLDRLSARISTQQRRD